NEERRDAADDLGAYRGRVLAKLKDPLKKRRRLRHSGRWCRPCRHAVPPPPRSHRRANVRVAICGSAHPPPGRGQHTRDGRRGPGRCPGAPAIMDLTERRRPMAEDMTVNRDGDMLVIRIPIAEATPSASGKTLVVASTRGNQKTGIQIDGKDLYLGVNAYVYAEPKGAR